MSECNDWIEASGFASGEVTKEYASKCGENKGEQNYPDIENQWNSHEHR